MAGLLLAFAPGGHAADVPADTAAAAAVAVPVGEPAAAPAPAAGTAATADGAAPCPAATQEPTAATPARGEDADTLAQLLATENGEPLVSERCVRSSAIHTTDVLNPHLVVFKLGRRDIYINQLPVNCPGLKPNALIAFESREDRLCQLDSIRVMYPAGMGVDGSDNLMPGAACMLGKFERITKEQLQVLEERYTPKRGNIFDTLFN